MFDLFEPTDKVGNGSDAFKTLDQIARENGFRTEQHTVTTDDGYILNIWRIPGAINETSEEKKPPVLLQHGLDGDMLIWVMNDPQQAPPFILARNGYDVWLGNNRGNKYSSQHVLLSNKTKEYWDGVDWE